jgi:hypothetical protein
MARYRFAWDNLPPRLLDSLRSELKLEGGAPDALRKAYGARPKLDFVHDTWPILRDAWLAHDVEARSGVIEALHHERLGNRDIATRSKAGQLEYLRSCRNSATLRGIVLPWLIRAGEQTAEPAPRTRPTEAPIPRRRAWDGYVEVVARILDALDAGQFLILSSADRPGFVQFETHGMNGLRAEAASNGCLPPDHQLDDDALDAALRLGWQPPTGQPDITPERDTEGSPNYFREWSAPVPYHDVARLAVDTLTEVFGVSHPGRVRYEAFTSYGTAILLPALGERAMRNDRLFDDQTWPASTVEVAEQVLAILREASGNDDLQPDDDGEMAIRFGSSVVFFQVFGDPPIVRAYSPALTQVPLDPKIAVALNELNSSTAFTKWLAVDDMIVAAIDLFGDPLVERHVVHACEVLGSTADDVDDQLQQQFGGKTFFGEYSHPKLTHESGGYL